MTGLVLCLFEGKEGLPMSPHVYYIPSVNQSMSQIWGLFEFPSLLNFPQWQNHFSVWWIHVDNTQSTGPAGKKKKNLTPLPQLIPLLPSRACLPFCSSLLFLNLGIFQTHSSAGFLGSVRNKREFLFKTRPSHSAAPKHLKTYAGLLILP